jgi:heterodisulfide reductase subunit A
MAEKVGVYICHCGSNIAGVVDVVDVAKWAVFCPERIERKGG